MADQAELQFVKNFVNILAGQPVVFDNDFQQLPEHKLSRVPILQVAVPPPPERTSQQEGHIGTVSVTFKSSKPPFSATLSVSPADAIATIKAQIAAQPNAPPADAQRLLLKGKALSDTKLLKEYAIKDGDTINLMTKPGFDRNAAPPALEHPPIVAPKPTTAAESGGTLELPASGPERKRGHTRIPSVVLSPSPSPSMEEVRDIPLVDEHGLTISAEPAEIPSLPQSTYRTTVSDPDYWEHLYSFLGSQFTVQSDIIQAFEDYLNASKGLLTASEIAKIRDHVGVTGMAGT